MTTEIRMFDIQRTRAGDIAEARVCNGHKHFTFSESGGVSNRGVSNCDNQGCQAEGSETVDASFFSERSQLRLDLGVPVPTGMVLVTGDHWDYYDGYENQFSSRCFSSRTSVRPAMLAGGKLLADGEGALFTSRYDVHYVRNTGGEAKCVKVGRPGSKRTAKKLAKLRQGERKSEESFDIAYLQKLHQELSGLRRTPEVAEQIEHIKELLQLATSLSLEVSLEAAEGTEQIAQELASSRAREIGAELQELQIHERLLREKAIRDAVQDELKGEL